MVRRGTESLHCNLGSTDYENSVRLIFVIGKHRVGQTNSVGPIAHFGETETLWKGNREFALRTRWDRSLISVRPHHYEGKQRVCNPISVRPRSLSVRLKWLGFCGSGYVKWTRWRRIEYFGGAEFDFLVWDICGYEKVVEGFWIISLSILSKQAIKQHLIPF